MSTSKNRNAFTLVELLTAVVVVSILAAMVVSALSAAAGTARKARAEKQVQVIHELIATRMEEFITRRVSAPVCANLPPLPFQGVTLDGAESNRSRLLELRHLLRTELPDRISDLAVAGPPHIRRVWTRTVDMDLDGKNDPWRSMDSILNPPSTPLPTGYTKYRNLVARLTGVTSGNPLATWSTKFEGSECLYLILATSQVGGRNGLELIPQSQIGDLDGDNVPEILDPWGNPMIWIRWPVGYWLTYGNRVEWLRDTNTGFASRRLSNMQSVIDRLGKDQFDILQSDWRNFREVRSRPPDVDSWTNLYGTFNIQPLVASAGPDGQFDMMLRSSGAATDPGPTWSYGTAVTYALTKYPVSGLSTSSTTVPATTYGSIPSAPAPEYDNPNYYIDPYLAWKESNDSDLIGHSVNYATTADPFSVGNTAGLPGAYYDANGDRVDDSVDNIFSLGAIQ